MKCNGVNIGFGFTYRLLCVLVIASFRMSIC